MVDEATIDAAIRGDRDARAALLTAAQDSWFRFAASILGDADAAAEAVQESALRVLQRLDGFNRQSTFLTWSMGIVLNVCRESRRRRRFASLTDQQIEKAGADEPAGIEQQEIVARLNEVLADLPDRQREAIVLRYFEELSVEDTARSMDCAAGTVKATVHQALRTLKSKLKSLR